jgi:hypothetical protein
MSDPIHRTATITGLDRFVGELGDALEAHARTVPPARPRPAVRSRRPLAAAAAAVAAALVAVAIGFGGESSREPASASAASFMRASARALARTSAGALPAGAYWHTRIEVASRGGEGRGFAYTTTTRVESWTARDGSGRERYVPAGPVEFTSPRDQRAWKAAGSPAVGEPGTDRRVPARARPFKLGTRAASYRELERLPTEPSALATQLRRSAARQDAAIPRDFDRSEARAYLLLTMIRDSFEAPTSPQLRAALYELAAETPGLRLDGATKDHTGRPGAAVSVVLGDARFVIVVDPRSGTLLETRRELLRRSRQFPGMAPGTITRATFLESDVTERPARRR